MKYKILIIILLTLILLSCFQKKSISIKYREKNQIDIVKINSLNGNVSITGWAKDAIEIYAKKRILSGFPTDLKNIDTKFELNDKEFIINSIIPARINGVIDLDIYLPYSILKLLINSNNGNIYITNILSDVELINNTGNIDLNFLGSFLRINAKKSNLNVIINTNESSDLIINNDNGDTSCILKSIGTNSFCDINSINGNINIILNQNLPHNLNVFYKEKMLNINYKLNNEILIKSYYNFLKGTNGNENNNINIYINSTNGNILIHKDQNE